MLFLQSKTMETKHACPHRDKPAIASQKFVVTCNFCCGLQRDACMCLSPRTVIAGDSWGLIAVPVIEAGHALSNAQRSGP